MRWTMFAIAAAGMVAGCTPSTSGGDPSTTSTSTSTTTSTTTTTAPCSVILVPRWLPVYDSSHVGNPTANYQMCPGATLWFMYNPIETITDQRYFDTTVTVSGPVTLGHAEANDFFVELHIDSQTGPLMAAPYGVEQVNPTVVGRYSDRLGSTAPNHVVYLKVTAGPDAHAGLFSVFATGSS
jgi:hypothetical protein